MRHFLLLRLAVASLPRCMLAPSPPAPLVPPGRLPLRLASCPRATGPFTVAVSSVAPSADVDLPAASRASIPPRRIHRHRASSKSAGQVSSFGTDSGPDRGHLRLPSSGDLAGRQPSSRSPLCFQPPWYAAPSRRATSPCPPVPSPAPPRYTPACLIRPIASVFLHQPSAGSGRRQHPTIDSSSLCQANAPPVG
jgi:hypothetical protein